MMSKYMNDESVSAAGSKSLRQSTLQKPRCFPVKTEKTRPSRINQRTTTDPGSQSKPGYWKPTYTCRTRCSCVNVSLKCIWHILNLKLIERSCCIWAFLSIFSLLGSFGLADTIFQDSKCVCTDWRYLLQEGAVIYLLNSSDTFLIWFSAEYSSTFSAWIPLTVGMISFSRRTMWILI